MIVIKNLITFFCFYWSVPCNYTFILNIIIPIAAIITNNAGILYRSHNVSRSASRLCFFFPSFTRREGNPSSLKILFVLFWHWREAGNWMARSNMIQNTSHFQPKWKYMVSALADSLPWLSPPSFSFHLLPNIFLFILSSSCFVHFSAIMPPSLSVHPSLSLLLPSIPSLTLSHSSSSSFSQFQLCPPFLSLPSIPHPLCIWLAYSTSSCGAC